MEVLQKVLVLCLNIDKSSVGYWKPLDRWPILLQLQHCEVICCNSTLILLANNMATLKPAVWQPL